MTLHGNSNLPAPHTNRPTVPRAPTAVRLDCPWRDCRLFWGHQNPHFALGNPSPDLEPLDSR